MDKLIFRVEEFDAPLDLILTLLGKNKLTIFDIDISSLLSQYMEQIRAWQDQNLDIASEFLEMASRLVHIKTASLLPSLAEEKEKLHNELALQLMEYQICKAAAQSLKEIDVSRDVYVRRPTRLDIDCAYKLSHSPGILYSALGDAMGKGERRRPPSRSTFEPLVERPIISVTSKVFIILRALRRSERVSWEELFSSQTERPGRVATFLAVLELVKSRKVAVDNNELRLCSR